jgi:predicted nucleotidyltransferase
MLVAYGSAVNGLFDSKDSDLDLAVVPHTRISKAHDFSRIVVYTLKTKQKTIELLKIQKPLLIS